MFDNTLAIDRQNILAFNGVLNTEKYGCKGVNENSQDVIAPQTLTA